MLRNIVHLSVRSVQHPKFLQATCIKSNTSCKYARWAHRRPVAIVNEDEVIEGKDVKPKKPLRQKLVTRDDLNKMVQSAQEKQENKTQKSSDITEKTKHTKHESSTVRDNIPDFITLTENDHLITSMMVEVKTRKKREKKDKIFLEGHRLIQDALQAGVVPEIIMFSRISDLVMLSLPKNVKLYRVPYRTIQLWSNLTTSPGIIGIFRMPHGQIVKPAVNTLPLTIICDNVRDPGNLGSILRVAAGVGCERLILMRGCVDLWEPKVLRTAAGAHFRLPIEANIQWSEISSLISSNSDVIVTDSNLIEEKPDSSNLLNTVNDDTNEIKNVSQATDSYPDLTDLSNKFDNAQFAQSRDGKSIIRQLLSHLPVLPYHKPDYTERDTVLIVPGETEGLSFQSLELLYAKYGVRVNIPLMNGVDSLNTGVAVGIVMFEIKRQFLEKQNELKKQPTSV